MLENTSVAEPTEVTVRTRFGADGRGAWAVGYQDVEGACRVTLGTVPAEGTPALTRAEASVAALTAVLTLAPELGSLSLDVPPAMEVRRAFSSALTSFPNIRLSMPGPGGPARDAVREALDEVVPTPIRKTLEVHGLVIATDASVASGGHVAGLGWVAAADDVVLACGKGVERVERRGDIALAELAAIGRAINGVASRGLLAAAQGPIRVLSDSRAALGTIRKVRAGKADGVPLPNLKQAETILTIAADFPVVFEWIKGHDGHRLNEVADRLAVMSRRNMEFGVTRTMGDKMFKGLQRELLGAAA